jgi:modulator of drug activity B
MKNVLIINAHQSYPGMSEGRLNATLVGVIREEMESKGHAVRTTEIGKGYDVDGEVEKHVWADIIVAQSPVFWFGCPWTYKKYVDEVFTAGLIQQKLLVDDGRTRQDPSRQYGSGGRMQGKKYMLSLTWNAPEESFGNPGQHLFEGRTVDDVFVANTANYAFCGAQIVPSFSCHDVLKQPRIEADIARLRAHLAEHF